MSTNLGVPYLSQPIDISATDFTITIAGGAQGIYNNTTTDGIVVAKLVSDSVARSWRIKSGTYLHGAFVSVTRTGSDAAFQAANALFAVRYWVAG